MQQIIGAAGFTDRWTRLHATSGFAWCVLWLVLCLPWLLGVWTIPFDAVQQFFPAVSFTAQQLLLGDVPWWNPYLHGGYPQLADPQMMTLQPTVVLPMVLAPTSLHWFTVVILLHVLVAGMGALKLAATQGLQRLPQLMFALVFLFGGVAAARLQHTPMIVSYCLLPWLWLALDQLRRHLHWRHAVLAGVVGGLCALQLTQVTYLIVLACAVFSIAAVLMAPTVFFLSMPFGVAPAAIQEIMPNSMRGQASAIYLFVITLIGLGIGPTAVALVTDYVFGDDMALRYSLLIVTSIAVFSSIVLLSMSLKPYRESVVRLQQWAAEPA